MNESRLNWFIWLCRALYAVGIIAAVRWSSNELREQTFCSAHAVLVLMGLTCLGGGAVVGVVLTWLISRSKA